MKFLKDDNPEQWEILKDHIIDMPDDWDGEYPIFCKKCGKEAVSNIRMLWMCPELLKIDPEYFHPG